MSDAVMVADHTDGISISGVEQLEQKLLHARDLQRRIGESGEVSQNDIKIAMESFGYEPPKYYNLGTYTLAPSTTNYRVTMEGIGDHIRDFIKRIINAIMEIIGSFTSGFKTAADEKATAETAEKVNDLKKVKTSPNDSTREAIQAALESGERGHRMHLRTALASLERFERIDEMSVDLMVDGELTKAIRSCEIAVGQQIENLLKAQKYALKYEVDARGNQPEPKSPGSYAEEMRVLMTSVDVASPEPLRRLLGVGEEALFSDNLGLLMDRVRTLQHSTDFEPKPSLAQARELLVRGNPRFNVPLNKVIDAQRDNLRQLDKLRGVVSNISSTAVLDEEASEKIRATLRVILSTLTRLDEYFNLIYRLHRVRRDVADVVLLHFRSLDAAGL